MGDFNFEMIKYETSKQAREFKNNMNTYDYYLCLNKPTRITNDLIDEI